MNTLSKTWLTDHLIDFEYKKYVVLDYVNHVKSVYQRSELYPYFSEAIEHFKNLNTVKENATFIKQEGGKSMSGFDWENMSIKYDTPPFDHEALSEVNKIIDFALPNFHNLVQHGKHLYDNIEKHLSISPVGIIPIRLDEGYLFLNETENKHLYVYQYSICKIEDIYEHSRMLALQYITDYHVSVTWNYETIKHDIIKTRKDLPNPAVYAISCGLTVPFNETFLPVAKRYFMQRVEKV